MRPDCEQGRVAPLPEDFEAALAPCGDRDRSRAGRRELATVEVILAYFVVRTVVTAVLLWVGIKVVAFSNPKNTLLRALGVAALGCAISLLPPYPLLALSLGCMVVASILLKAYELDVGQTVAVMCFVLLANIAAFKALGDLAGRL